ncbi:MAG: glycoside hydrolase family 92 protein [Verrucomicrobiota bacterium]
MQLVLKSLKTFISLKLGVRRTKVVAGAVLFAALTATAATPSPVESVNVFNGTGAHGHTYPGATTPFGMVQLSPDTPMKGWDGCSGYHYSDSKILGFSHTHLSGTGIGDLGDISVMPVTGELQEGGNYRPLTAERLASEFSHGNEPCHHVAYLYALAGVPHKTALRVRQILAMHYDNTTGGICGNDDCGQMSAWYVWSALGLYPVNPANGVYVIGGPIVEKATIRLDPKYYKGGTFTVVARNVSNQNIYVQSAKLNGQALNQPWITHEQLAGGGTLELEMGILPNPNWGKAE